MRDDWQNIIFCISRKAYGKILNFRNHYVEEREKLEMKKKLLTLVLALSMVTVATATNGMEAKAATASWSLRYIHHAESSANVTSWARYLNTTKTTTTAKINNVGGSARVCVISSNGINLISAGTATASIEAVKNTQIYALATYSDYGTSNSFPTGSVEY